MPDKVYCIVQLEDSVYIPIKAEKNPYSGRDAYLKGLPNFFGGTRDIIEYDESGRVTNTIVRTSAEALSAELREESRNKINVDEADISSQLTDANTLLNAQVEESQYWFCLINIQVHQLGMNASQEIWNFCFPSRRWSENEMEYVVKVPIADIIKDAEAPADLAALLNSPIDQAVKELIDRFAGKVLSACSTVFTKRRPTGCDSDYFGKLIQASPGLCNDWNASETRKAFAKLAAVLCSR